MAEINWNAPLQDNFTLFPVYVHSVQTNDQFGQVVIVQDAKGRKLPFSTSGAPLGHHRAISNSGGPAIATRFRLVQLIGMRARQMFEDESMQEMTAMKNVDAWGMF